MAADFDPALGLSELGQVEHPSLEQGRLEDGPDYLDRLFT